MTPADFLTCFLIFVARIGDVSIGTVRTVFIMQGRRGLSWFLGFFEVLIWIFAVSSVITNLKHPAFAISYALGFATGNYVGLTIEQWLAVGRQVVRIFTRQGAAIAEALRAADFGVTQFDGHGRDGPVQSLYIETVRRRVPIVLEQARALDPTCYYVIDDVREASPTAARRAQSSWWSLVRRK